jgi:hypothetical protein
MITQEIEIIDGEITLIITTFEDGTEIITEK